MIVFQHDSLLDSAMANAGTAVQKNELQKSVWELRTAIVVFLTAVAPAIGVFIAWVNGVFALTEGASIFQSRGFWVVYGGIWVFISVGAADLLWLRMMHRRYARQSYIMIEAPKGYYHACAATFMAVFGAYDLWLWDMAIRSDNPIGWSVVLFFVTYFGGAYGLVGLPDAARDIDRAFFPWDWDDPG